MGDRVVMDAMLLVEHVVLDMVIGWWTRLLGCVAVVGCNFWPSRFQKSGHL